MSEPGSHPSGTNREVSYVSECEDCHFRMEWEDEDTADKRASYHAEENGHDTFTYTEVSYIAE